jgi:thiol:disulfide interchange protein
MRRLAGVLVPGWRYCDFGLGGERNLTDDGGSWQKETVMTAAKFRTGLIAAGMALVMSVGAQAQIMPGRAHIYPSIDAAEADIHAAEVEARHTHKRVLLDFGGDWCGDCQVLDIYFHQPPNAELLEKNFVKVNVNIGEEDANLDLAKRYGVPMPHGVPALAVLNGQGKLLYAQGKEFEDMRYMQPQAVTEFLEKWKR